MTHIEHTVLIQAPVEKAFAYAADYRTWSDWFEGVADFKSTGPVTQGNSARYSYRAQMMGVSAAVETEIHDFEVNRGWKGTATKGMPHRTQWIFESIDGDTRFTYILEYQIPVPLLGPILDSLFMKPAWKRLIQKSLNNLAAHFRR